MCYRTLPTLEEKPVTFQLTSLLRHQCNFYNPQFHGFRTDCNTLVTQISYFQTRESKARILAYTVVCIDKGTTELELTCVPRWPKSGQVKQSSKHMWKHIEELKLSMGETFQKRRINLKDFVSIPLRVCTTSSDHNTHVILGI